MKVKEDSQEDVKKESPLEIDFGFNQLSLKGIFKGLEKLIDLTDKLENTGESINKQGEFTVKGNKDLKGIYGFSIRTALGKHGEEKPIVQPFGNIKKTAKGTVVEDTLEPITDVFTEGDIAQVIIELPGVNKKEVQYTIKGDIFELKTTGKKKYSKEILLPFLVHKDAIEENCSNGILELKFKKE